MLFQEGLNIGQQQSIYVEVTKPVSILSPFHQMAGGWPQGLMIAQFTFGMLRLVRQLQVPLKATHGMLNVLPFHQMANGWPQDLGMLLFAYGI